MKSHFSSRRRATSSSKLRKSSTVFGSRALQASQARSASQSALPAAGKRSSSRTSVTKQRLDPKAEVASISLSSSSSQNSRASVAAVSSTVRDVLLASPYGQSPLLADLLSKARRETNTGFCGGRKKPTPPLVPVDSDNEETDATEAEAPSARSSNQTAVRPLHGLLANSKAGNIVSVSLVAILPNGLDPDGSLCPPAHLKSAKFALLVEDLVRCGLAVKASSEGQVFRFDKSWNRAETLGWLRAILPSFFTNYKANYGIEADLHVVKKQGHGHFDPVDGTLCGQLLADNRGRRSAPICDSAVILTPSANLPEEVYLAWSEDGGATNNHASTSGTAASMGDDDQDGMDLDSNSSDSDSEDSNREMDSDYVATSRFSPVKRRSSTRIAQRGTKRSRSVVSDIPSDDSDEDRSHLGPVAAKGAQRKASKRPKRPVSPSEGDTTIRTTPVGKPPVAALSPADEGTAKGEPLFFPSATSSPMSVVAESEPAPTSSTMDIDDAVVLPEPELFIEESGHISSYENVWHTGYRITF
ncbi:hypothetical protein GGG16DRAFT_58068 [Schizophyllum commune]